MELRHLRYFVTTAEELNVTKAAIRLGIAQPPLTQQIKALESELGVHLFTRIGRRIALTEAGILFLAEARAILERANQAISIARSAGRGDTGTLRVGFTGSAGFNPVVTSILSRFRTGWPQVVLGLEENRTSRLLSALSAGAIDAAFVRPPADGDGKVISRIVSTETMVVAVPASHALAAQADVSLAALHDEAFILYPRDGGLGLSELVVAACLAAGFQPRVVQQSPQMTSTINLVAASIGIAVVPQCMSPLRPDAVRFLAIQGPALMADLHLAYRRDDQSPLLRNLVAVADLLGIAQAGDPVGVRE